MFKAGSSIDRVASWVGDNSQMRTKYGPPIAYEEPLDHESDNTVHVVDLISAVDLTSDKGLPALSMEGEIAHTLGAQNGVHYIPQLDMFFSDQGYIYNLYSGYFERKNVLSSNFHAPFIARKGLERAIHSRIAPDEDYMWMNTKSAVPELGRITGIDTPAQVNFDASSTEAVDGLLLGFDIVIKPDRGSCGDNVQYINAGDFDNFNNWKKNHQEGEYVAQERIFAPPLEMGEEKYDWNIRVIFSGRMAVMSYARFSSFDGPVNVSIDAKRMSVDSLSDRLGPDVDIHSALETVESKVSRHIGDDLMALDLIFDADHNPVIIEANYGEAIGFGDTANIHSQLFFPEVDRLFMKSLAQKNDGLGNISFTDNTVGIDSLDMSKAVNLYEKPTQDDYIKILYELHSNLYKSDEHMDIDQLKGLIEFIGSTIETLKEDVETWLNLDKTDMRVTRLKISTICSTLAEVLTLIFSKVDDSTILDLEQDLLEQQANQLIDFFVYSSELGIRTTNSLGSEVSDKLLPYIKGWEDVLSNLTDRHTEGHRDI